MRLPVSYLVHFSFRNDGFYTNIITPHMRVKSLFMNTKNIKL